MFSTPAVVGELIYIGSCSGVLYALDRDTGRPRWSRDVRPRGLPTSFHGDAAIVDSMLVIGSDGGAADTTFGEVWAFHLATGRPIWRRSTTDGIVSDVVRAGDRLLVITRADSLLCMDAGNGRLLWSFRGGEPSHAAAFRSPAVIGGRVFFGASDGFVHALDLDSGRVLWQRDLRDRIGTSVLALDGAIYVGVGEGEIHRLRQDTGEVENRLSVGTAVFGPPTAVGDSLIALASVQRITVVDRRLGAIRWLRTLPAELSSSRPYLWHDVVLAGTTKGELFAFRAGDGLPRWAHALDGTIRGIGVGDRVLYVGTLKGLVHALARPGVHPRGR